MQSPDSPRRMTQAPARGTVVRTISPPLAGFSVTVLNGDDRLEASNRGSQALPAPANGMGSLDLLEGQLVA